VAISTAKWPRTPTMTELIGTIISCSLTTAHQLRRRLYSLFGIIASGRGWSGPASVRRGDYSIIYLESWDIDNLLTSQNVDQPKDPASENSQALDGSALKAFAGQQHDAHILAHLLFGLSPIMAASPQTAILLQKHIFDHIKIKAEEATEAELFQQYGTDPENLVSPLQKEAMVALKVAEYFQEVKKLQSELSGEGQQQPDPLIELKKAEIQQRGQVEEAKIGMDKQRLAFDQQREQNDVAMDQARLQQAEQLTMAKLTQNQQKMAQQGGRNAQKTQ